MCVCVLRIYGGPIEDNEEEKKNKTSCLEHWPAKAFQATQKYLEHERLFSLSLSFLASFGFIRLYTKKKECNHGNHDRLSSYKTKYMSARSFRYPTFLG